MPQGEQFWNPYRMVPIRQGVSRSTPMMDERFRGQSGRIHCHLENLTPLFVGKRRISPTQFLLRDGKCVVPGSSLKGALRSLAEIIGGGCFSTNARGRGDRYFKILDDSYKACDDNRQLCITCRMFGMMGRGPSASVLKGKVNLGDALMTANNVNKAKFEVVLMNHGARHTQFYETPGTGRFDGLCRKMYFHQAKRTHSVPSIPGNIRKMMQGNIQQIEALLPGHQFDFEVQFTSLNSSELELLIYVLALEDNIQTTIKQGQGELHLQGPMRHKIGFAKPLGMGSCRISIRRIEYLCSPLTRFSSLREPVKSVLEGADLMQEIEHLTRSYARDMSPTMIQLRKMMVWDETDSRTFEYPDYAWFKNQANAGVKLKAV